MVKPYQDMDLVTFQQHFATEDSCRERLFKLRWPEGFRCPRCGGDRAYLLEKRMLYQCTTCKFQTSLTAGTVMHKTRTPLVKWFWAIYLVSTDKRGLSALALSRKVGIGIKCAWMMLHKIRKAMSARDSEYQLAGLIQVDDAFFNGGIGKGGDKRGRGTNKSTVLVMVSGKETTMAFAKMKMIDSVDGENIKSVLAEHVASRQTIRSDGFPAYNVVTEISHTHDKQIIHPKNEPPRYDLLKWINIIVSNAKAFILGTYHGVKAKHLQRYLDEYCYRFNRRFWPGQAFDRLLLACSRSKTVTYAELRA